MPTTPPSSIPVTIVIVGDGGVGKSSVTLSLLRREFSHDYDPTIEDSYSTDLVVDGQEYSVSLVDTAGQEEYRGAWGESTVREGDGFICCYSIDSAESFELIPDFLHVIRKVKHSHDNPTSAPTPENTPFPFLLLGNKCDLPPNRRVVSAQSGLAFARGAGGLFYETSALNGVNVHSSFESLVRAIARSKSARAAYLKSHPKDKDCDGFNGNVGVLDKLEAATKESSARTTGFDEEEELSLEAARERQRSQRGKRSDLAMDRRRSKSIGGLGRDPSTYEEKQKGCGCVVC